MRQFWIFSEAGLAGDKRLTALATGQPRPIQARVHRGGAARRKRSLSVWGNSYEMASCAG
jgi:hypothetical protein